jgi:hypothetical protein
MVYTTYYYLKDDHMDTNTYLRHAACMIRVRTYILSHKHLECLYHTSPGLAASYYTKYETYLVFI